MTFDEFIATERPLNKGKPIYDKHKMRSAYNAGFEHGCERTMEKFGVRHFDVWHYPEKGELPKLDEMTRVLIYDGGTFCLGWYIPNGRKWLYNGYTQHTPSAWQYLPDCPKEVE